MSGDRLTAEVVFDTSVVEDPGDAVLAGVARVLAGAAPAWADRMVAWSPEPRERREIDALATLPDVVRGRTRWATQDRHTGNVELRGATAELNVVVSVNSSPLARVGGRLLLSNGITLTGLREQVAGEPRTDWMRAVFGEICAATRPVWGALYSASEYRAKVMADGPVLRALGRDFSRHLPGLFAGNYFGAPYVGLIGERVFERIGAPAARKAADGWFVDVLHDPFAWRDDDSVTRNADLLAELGPECFFRKGAAEGRVTRAPDW
ncbi:hypothetical protein ABZZ79_37410 [Streptomyces sp. NPDC006458]|uniref:hypothetical protein n=1 Tax=Streptomyces sp. NPDC006458 TaxID=3154302 RepID=UPI0033ADBE09